MAPQFVHTYRPVCDLDHPVECSTALPRGTITVGQHISEPDPAMTAWLLERDLTGLEELHQRRPAHAQQIRCLLGRQPLMHRRDGHRLSVRHRLHDITKDFEHLGRENQPLTVRARERRGRFRARA